MRRALFLVGMMIVQPAFAGDLIIPQPPEYTTDWSGAYVGIFGGLGVSSGQAKLGDYSGTLIPLDVSYGLFPNDISANHTGAAAGVAAGMNFQSGAFVGGFEADLGYAWTESHNDFSRLDTIPGSPFNGVNTNTGFETDFGAIGSVRARAGYAFGDTLLFATAGLAAGQVNNRFSLSLPELNYSSPDWSASGMRLGYVIGAGVEQKVASNVSVKFETLYYNLADRTVDASDPAAFPGEAISYRFSNDVLMPRLGLSVQF